MDRRWENAFVGLDIHYWDNLDRALDEFTLQQLPYLSFDVAPDHIGSLPLYYTLNTNYVNYWRKEGDRGNRINLFPRAHLPLHWKTYLNVEPSFGLQSTFYQVDWEKDKDQGNTQSRFLPDVNVLMSSRVNKVYSFGENGDFSLQHAIRPEVLYTYVPEVDQDDLPIFDDVDRIPKQHDIRYGLSTFVTAKTTEKDAEDESVTNYKEMARLRVSQAYNIEESPYTQREAASPSNNIFISPLVVETDSEYYEYEKERFSPINIELDLTPGRYIYLDYSLDISHEEAYIESHDVFFTLDSHLGQSMFLNYRFLRDTVIDELTAGLKIDVLSNLYVNTYHNYSFDRQEMYRQGYGMTFQRGCWGVTMGYEKENEDKRFTVSLNLLGLGKVGGDFSFKTDPQDSIPSEQ
jgi:LPS-assembly protein